MCFQRAHGRRAKQRRRTGPVEEGGAEKKGPGLVVKGNAGAEMALDGKPQPGGMGVSRRGKGRNEGEGRGSIKVAKEEAGTEHGSKGTAETERTGLCLQ